MAEYDFKCPNCGNTLRIDEAHQGKRTTCPACQKEITTPTKPAERAPQPKVVSPAAAAAPGAGMGDLLPQEEKEVLSFRPTMKMYLGRLFLALLIAAGAVALSVVVNASPAVERALIIAGLAVALILFFTVLYKKYSV